MKRKRRTKAEMEIINTRKNYHPEKSEMETVIQFDLGVEEATIYTAMPAIVSKLDKLGYTKINSTMIEGKVTSTTYTCPKRCISFRNIEKRKSKPISEERQTKE